MFEPVKPIRAAPRNVGIHGVASLPLSWMVVPGGGAEPRKGAASFLHALFMPCMCATVLLDSRTAGTTWRPFSHVGGAAAPCMAPLGCGAHVLCVAHAVGVRASSENARSTHAPTALLRLLSRVLGFCFDEFEPWLKWKVYDVLFALLLVFLGRRLRHPVAQRALEFVGEA